MTGRYSETELSPIRLIGLRGTTTVITGSTENGNTAVACTCTCTRRVQSTERPGPLAYSYTRLIRDLFVSYPFATTRSFDDSAEHIQLSLLREGLWRGVGEAR